MQKLKPWYVVAFRLGEALTTLGPIARCEEEGEAEAYDMLCYMILSEQAEKGFIRSTDEVHNGRKV